MIEPSEVPSRHQLLSRLRLPAGVAPGQIRTGFLRLTVDGQGGAPLSIAREVEQYEGGAGENDLMPQGAGVVEIVLGGAAPQSIATLAMAEEHLAVGTTDGMVQLFDHGGTGLSSYRVGRGPVTVLMDHRQSRATYSGGLLTLFDGMRITGFVNLPEYYAEMAVSGSDVVVWRGAEVWVVNRRGRVVWRATFARRIGTVIVHRLGFNVLAGALFTFDRTPPGEGLELDE